MTTLISVADLAALKAFATPGSYVGSVIQVDSEPRRSYSVFSGTLSGGVEDGGSYIVSSVAGPPFYYYVINNPGLTDASFYDPARLTALNIQALGGATVGSGATTIGGLSLQPSAVGNTFVAWQPGVAGAYVRGTITSVSAGVGTFSVIGSSSTAAITNGCFVIGPPSKDKFQAAIDWTIYGAGSSLPTKRGVRLPSGAYAVEDVISLGYGVTNFVQGAIEGDMANFGGNGASVFGGPDLVSTFSDRPVINVQGCVLSDIKQVGIDGLNQAWIQLNGLGDVAGPANNDLDDTDIATWWDASLSSTGNSRDAPYAGIVIDGYNAAQPTTHYPAVTYPSYISAGGQYNKLQSSLIRHERPAITGFYAAVCIHPNRNTDGQGDFVTYTDAKFFYNVIGASLCDQQGRNFVLRNGQTQNVHTVLATATNGGQVGRASGGLDNHGMNQVIKLLAMPNSNNAGSFNLTNSYCEAAWQIGEYGSDNSSGGRTLSIIGCDLGFESQNDARGYPPYLLNTGNASQTTFDGGQLLFPTFNVLDGPPSHYAVRNISVYNYGVSTYTNPYQWLASNYWTGGLVFNPARANPPPAYRPSDFSVRPINVFNVDTGTTGVSNVQGQTAVCDRGHPIYYGAKWVSPSNDGWSVTPTPVAPWPVLKTGGLISSMTRSGTTLTLTMAAGWNAASFAIRGGSNGDCILDDNDLSVYVIHSVSGQVITATLLNNYRHRTSGALSGYAYFNAFSSSAGSIWFFNTRCYCPSVFLQGDITSGSAVIDNVATKAGDSSLVGVTDLLVGDYILDNNLPDMEGGPYGFFPLGTKINAIGAGTLYGAKLTMSANSNLLTGSVTRAPLLSWVRPPPTNV